MIYPDNFEKKIGFSDIRTQLKGRCMSVLGTEWVDRHLQFSRRFVDVQESLRRVSEFAQFMQEEDDVYEEHFFDVRQPLLRIRPDRTYMEEIDLFDLKRSLATVVALVDFFRRDNEANADTETASEEPTDHARQYFQQPPLPCPLPPDGGRTYLPANHPPY